MKTLILLISLSVMLFAYESETRLSLSSFESTTTEGWYVRSGGGFDIASSDAVAYSGTYSLHVSNRQNTYDGAFFNLGTLLEANTTYVVRGQVRRDGTTDETFILNLKIGNSTYISLSRVLIENDEWSHFRAFVRLSQAEIDSGVLMYITTNLSTQSYYLDDVEIAKSRYDPSTDTGNILSIEDGILKAGNTAMQIQGINLVAYDDDSGATDDSASEFMNYAYYNYDKEDFKTLAKLGFNSVRLTLWYRYFEDESNPYVYREAGFEWLNTVIGWAKEAGIYVLLDMHAPQGGGFQGPNNITSFWSVSDDYRNRFKALWLEMARRYKNAATIAGYDLLNEPCPPNQSNYTELLNALIPSMRAVDAHHIINVENSFSNDATLFKLAFDNIMYDFHFYDPWSAFTAHSTSVYGVDVHKTQITQWLDEYTNFYAGEALHVGEFGQKYASFDAKNSVGWVADVIDYLQTHGTHFHYFSFKGNEFGLYESNNAFAQNSPRNDTLAELFHAQLYKAKTLQPSLYYLLLN